MDKNIPFFSIVIPTYNSGKVLRKCLDSIMTQSYHNYEVLVLDGLSTDNTVFIAQSFSDDRIKITIKKDDGIYDAMNKGVDLAIGDYVYFIGSDDCFYDNKVLADVAKTLENTRSDVMYGNVVFVGDSSWVKDGHSYDGPFTTEKLLRQNISHQAIFYKRTYLRRMGYYNINYTICADWDLNLRCWAHAPFYFSDRIIAFFYTGGASTSGKTDLVFSQDFVKNILGYFQISPFHPLVNSSSFHQKGEIEKYQRAENIWKYGLIKVYSKFLFYYSVIMNKFKNAQ